MATPYLTVDDVRRYILDRGIQDNALALDLAFSDPEIKDAMLRAARAFNTIPPIGVMIVNDGALPNDTNIMLDGTVYQLYVSKIAMLSRNDIDYDAGGVTTNLVAKQIKNLRDMAKERLEAFEKAATDLKLAVNIMGAFRVLG